MIAFTLLVTSQFAATYSGIGVVIAWLVGISLALVTAYFAYANRTVLGLGVTTDGDILGLSPNASDGDDWKHQ